VSLLDYVAFPATEDYRWGYMLMADPARALAETRRDGGRLSLSVLDEVAVRLRFEPFDAYWRYVM